MIRVIASVEELVAMGIQFKTAELMASGRSFRVLNYRIHNGRRLLFLEHHDPRSNWCLWIYEDMTEDVKSG